MMLRAWHTRRRWSRDERQTAWLVAVICLSAIVIAALLLTGRGVVQ